MAIFFRTLFCERGIYFHVPQAFPIFHLFLKDKLLILKSETWVC